MAEEVTLSMTLASERLGGYLVADESLEAVTAGKLFGDSSPVAVAIGITDRRLLCLSEDGEFVDVKQDYIASIRSRRRTRLSYRGNDHRLLMGAGGLLAAAAFGGGFSLAWSAHAAGGVLAFAALLAAGASEYVRRQPGDASEHHQQMVGSALLAAVAFVGVVVLTASVVVVPLLSLVTAGGLAVTDYAHRHRSEFEGIELVRRSEKEISVDTVNGRTVRVVIDSGEEIDRELSRLAYVEDRDPSTSTTGRDEM